MALVILEHMINSAPISVNNEKTIELKQESEYDKEYLCKLKVIQRVRRLLNDYAHANRLHRTEQISDSYLMETTDYVITIFNETLPVITRFTVCNFPQTEVLVNGILAETFKTLMMTDARNAYFVQAGEVQVQDDKTQVYAQLAQMFEQTFKQLTVKLKTYLNIQQGYGSWWSW